MTLKLLPSKFLIYEENLIFFISVLHRQKKTKSNLDLKKKDFLFYQCRYCLLNKVDGRRVWVGAYEDDSKKAQASSYILLLRVFIKVVSWIRIRIQLFTSLGLGSEFREPKQCGSMLIWIRHHPDPVYKLSYTVIHFVSTTSDKFGIGYSKFSTIVETKQIKVNFYPRNTCQWPTVMKVLKYGV